MRNSYRQQPSAHLIKVYKTGAKGLRFFYLMIPKGFEIFSPVYSLTVALSEKKLWCEVVWSAQ